MKKRLLEILKNEKNFVSGEKISEEFGVSRTYIWKLIRALKEDGYIIESGSNRGYKFIESPDILTYEEIKDFLNTNTIGRDIEYFKTIDSTNTYAKKVAKDSAEGKIIVSEEQTEGKGRLGRYWKSENKNGLYFSIILKPKLSPENISRLTLIGAAAVYLGLKEMNIETKIKWPNDILINNKKICGILTEMSGEIGRIDYIIMGIGINVNNDVDNFDNELKIKGSSLKIELNREIDRKRLFGNIINNFEELYYQFIEEDNFSKTLEIARENSILIGEEARIVNNKNEEFVKVIDINEDGELVVEKDGVKTVVYSGEVSLRGKESYTK